MVPAISDTIKRVEKARFAGVGKSHERDAHAVLQSYAAIVARFEALESRADFGQARFETRQAHLVDVLVREVDPGFGQHGHLAELGRELVDDFVLRARHLFEGERDRAVVGRGDEIGDRLRLRERHFSVSHGPEAELAGKRLSHALSMQGFHHPVGQKRASVEVELDDVLARVAFGLHETHEKRVVERRSLRVEESRAHELSLFRAPVLLAPGEASERIESPGPAHADHRKRTAYRRADRGDGITREVGRAIPHARLRSPERPARPANRLC